MHHDGGNLTILHLAQDDGGHYECVASNQVANAITTTLLLIESTAAGFCYHTHTHTHTFNGPFSGTTQVSRNQKGKTNLDFTEARYSEWQWHQLGHMQVCTSLQTDNHTSTPPLCFLQAGCPSCRPTNSVKALKAPVSPIIAVVKYIQKLIQDLKGGFAGTWRTKVLSGAHGQERR